MVLNTDSNEYCNDIQRKNNKNSFTTKYEYMKSLTWKQPHAIV